MTQGNSAPLAGLPPALRGLLLQAGVGKLHLARAAQMALELAEPAWPGLARALFTAAWEYDPLDGNLARTILSLPGEPPAPRLSALLEAVARAYKAPADLKYYFRLAARRDHDKIHHYLGRQRASEPGNLFWIGRELTHYLATSEFDAAGELAGRGLTGEFAPVVCKLLGDIRLCQGEARDALGHYDDFSAAHDGAGTVFGRARALAMLGETGRARDVLRQATQAHPWCVNALLALYDQSCGRETSLARLPADAAVLLYTFNKAAELRITLASLERSLAYGGHISRIVALDNGSTDATAEVLSQAADRLGADVMRVISLPVNIGAPAARNWLMRSPEVGPAEFVAYLDDDVDLPGDWLSRLAAAVAAYPGAGVYGCKVVDQARPLQIQSADLHFVEVSAQAQEEQAQRALPTTWRFEISSAHHQVLDFGQFDYLRPCASVTGCLHLFKTKTLVESGAFDLRFSPSQFDDLDHDFKLLALGKTPVYQGLLGLPHFKRTGAFSGTEGAGHGIGFANQYKLHGKYSPEQLAQMAQAAGRAVWEDYLAKWSVLHEQALLP